jgi:hypothetical protein
VTSIFLKIEDRWAGESSVSDQNYCAHAPWAVRLWNGYSSGRVAQKPVMQFPRDFLDREDPFTLAILAEPGLSGDSGEGER